jgi:predicted nucleotidyltransferase
MVIDMNVRNSFILITGCKDKMDVVSITKDEIKSLIINAMYKYKIPISQIYFRGSILSLKQNIHDIDLLIVSDIFSGIDINYRKKIIKNMFDVNYIDPICLTIMESKVFLNAIKEKVELFYECEY